METFRIRRDPMWRMPLALIGATEAGSRATLEADAIQIHFGIARVRVPYSNIASVRERDWGWWLGIGVRVAGDKTLGLVGSTRGVVQIALKEPTVRGVLFISRPRNVAVSLEDPAGFIAAVERRAPGR